MASTSLASNASAAASPSIGTRSTFDSSSPIIARRRSISARVPLPSAPTATRRPAIASSCSDGMDSRTKIHSGSRNTLASETRSKVSPSMLTPAWMKATSTPSSGSVNNARFSAVPSVSTSSSVTPSDAR